VMENAVQKLGSVKFRLTINLQTDSWGKILADMNNVLSPPGGTTPTMTFTTTEKEELAQTLALLKNVKNAWRNRTMHPRARGYTKQEARDTFHAVKAFLEHLASLI
jgi:hypothetical protein